MQPHKIPELKLDMNRKCESCGARGVLEVPGKCLGCIGEDLRSGQKSALNHLPDYWLVPEEIVEVAKRLISDHHPEAANAKICFLFRKRHTSMNGHVRAGSCSKQSLREKLLHGFDYVIQLAWDLWVMFDERQREALMLHEICHIFKDGEASPSWKIEGHNVEEFSKVIEVYGLWEPNLEAMAAAVSPHIGAPQQIAFGFGKKREQKAA
jgi:hypothetical protein